MKEYDTLEATLRFHEQLVKAIIRLAGARLTPYRPTEAEKQILEYSARQVAEAKHAYYLAVRDRILRSRPRPGPWDPTFTEARELHLQNTGPPNGCH